MYSMSIYKGNGKLTFKLDKFSKVVVRGNYDIKNYSSKIVKQKPFIILAGHLIYTYK